MKNWLIPDRNQLLLLPPCVDDLLPKNHLARFVVEVVERLDLSPILQKYEARGRGSTPYHPSILVALLFYGYTTGTMSSRKIERAAHYDIAFRFIAAGHHPDHDTIADFRRRHLAELSALFLRVLEIAREMGFLKVGTVAIDGTKIKANASKHAAVSYKRAKEIEAGLRAEIDDLMKKAEAADNEPVAEGVDIPKEIERREKRIENLEKAQRAIQQRHAEQALAEYEQELAKTLEKTETSVKNALSRETRKKPPDPPEPPDPTLEDKAQHNFTDQDSRIMPDKGGFTQAYNAQLSVDTETMLITGNHLSQNPNDKKELLPAIARMDKPPASVLADAGYFSEANIAGAPGIDLYISPGRTKHNKTLEAILLPPAAGEAPPDATPAGKMRHKLRTEKGKSLYRLRKMTVEPVIGIIKQAMGFRQFLLRGLEKTSSEWGLVCLAYNLRRLYSLKTAARA